MHHVPESDQRYGFFKASHVTTYLEEYCREHTYKGCSIAERVRTGCSVERVSKSGDVWLVEITCVSNTTARMTSRHVVDASGLTSVPNWPNLPGREVFAGEILHHKDFATFEQTLKLTPPKTIVVIGGAKSAADVAYACAKSHKVTWLIRESGSGPAAFVSPKGMLGYQNSNESFYTRFTSLFLASWFSLQMGYGFLLRTIHRSALGRRMLQRVWQRVDDKAWREADYDRIDGRANGFSNLKPDTSIFWQNDSTGVNQREDFFDVIAKQTRVLRKDISHLVENAIVLSDGSLVEAGVIICATGWKNEHRYYGNETISGLGLMSTWDKSAATDAKGLEAEVHNNFPILDSRWRFANDRMPQPRSTAPTPYCLWKSMVPIHDPSIIFVGKIMLGNHFRAAEVQALFACAVLAGFPLPSPDEMERDVAMTNIWCQRRYLNKGLNGNWFYWDMIPYTDMLLSFLGLGSHRHASLVQDLFSPCVAKDLRGLLDEFRAKHRLV